MWDCLSSQVVEQGMFVKHCKVEVYLTELKLCKDSNMDTVITRRFSKADTIGKKSLLFEKNQQIGHCIDVQQVIGPPFLFHCMNDGNMISRGELSCRKVCLNCLNGAFLCGVCMVSQCLCGLPDPDHSSKVSSS